MTPTDPTPPRGVSIVPESDQPLVDARQDGAIARLRHRQLWAVVLSIVAAVLAAVDLVVAVADVVDASAESDAGTSEASTARGLE